MMTKKENLREKNSKKEGKIQNSKSWDFIGFDENHKFLLQFIFLQPPPMTHILNMLN